MRRSSKFINVRTHAGLELKPYSRSVNLIIRNVDNLALNRLKIGEQLARKESLYSPNRQYRAALEEDGTFVLFSSRDHPVWHSNTYNVKDATHVIMQPDGNFVLYRALGRSKAAWSSGTSGHHDAPEATLENDGRLRIIAGGEGIWSVGK